MTEFDGRVAGAGRLGAVPLSASEPTRDPKAGVRHTSVYANAGDKATAVSGRLIERFNDRAHRRADFDSYIAAIQKVTGVDVATAEVLLWNETAYPFDQGADLFDAIAGLANGTIRPQSATPTSPDSH